MQRGSLFVISGPSGTGKGEIVKRLLAKHPDVAVSTSCTTRAPRPGEVNGREYHFVTDEEFDRLVAEGAFYEWAHVHQNRYGTLKSVVAQQLDQGKDLILEIDVQGCREAAQQDSNVVSIFVCPPSRENLEKRLRGRGTETEESIRVRLGHMAGEIDQAFHYDYVIVHQDWNDVPDALEIAVEEVYAIICARRVSVSKKTDFLKHLTASLRK